MINNNIILFEYTGYIYWEYLMESMYDKCSAENISIHFFLNVLFCIILLRLKLKLVKQFDSKSKQTCFEINLCSVKSIHEVWKFLLNNGVLVFKL